ncbi:MAG: PTS sugar transporter subunit IIA [Atopobiaceae bacterium]|nr:PTS sugar transporter subunit IIA [Atopobiaceae bacterium]
MLMREICEKQHYAFVNDAIDDWRDAIRACCRPLEADGTVEGCYAEEIIACVERFGPYIVLMPGVAMPHSMESARGCNRTAIGFMRLAHPVSFDPSDPERDAQIFFTLCATNRDEHFANMRRLYAVLTDEEVVERLKAATTPDDLLAIDAIVDEEKFEKDQA